jgi:hypothetical protein
LHVSSPSFLLLSHPIDSDFRANSLLVGQYL